MNVYLDIETIPGQNPAIKEQIAAAIDEVPPLVIPTCPKHYKKEETIHAWYQQTLPQLMQEAQQKHQLAIEKREALIEENWRKTALTGEYGHVVCIGWAVEDEEPRALLYAASDCEKQLLQDFFTTLSQQLNQRQPTWIGHHISFDLRFLFQRAVVHDVFPSINLQQDASPYGGLIFDTMQIWAGWHKTISLDRLCLALGLPGKTPLLQEGSDYSNTQNDNCISSITDGSQVWDFIQQNKLDEVMAYCKADVERCRAVYKRLTFASHFRPATWVHTLKPDTEMDGHSGPLAATQNKSKQTSIAAGDNTYVNYYTQSR
jgi:hypothetical protein